VVASKGAGTSTARASSAEWGSPNTPEPGRAAAEGSKVTPGTVVGGGPARSRPPRRSEIAYRRGSARPGPTVFVFASSFSSGMAPEPGCRFACALRSASYISGSRR